MKAAYLCSNPETITRVYAERQHAALQSRVGLVDGVCTDVRDGRLRDVEAVFSTWGMPSCTEEEIREYLPGLRAVFYAAGSVQGFARPFLNAGVRVFSAWQANAVPVAQYTFAQILLALKGYFAVQDATRRSRGEAQKLFENYPGVYGVRVGLLGCGAIGGRVAELLRSTDVEVLVYDPFLPDDRAAALNVRRTTLDEIFATCDVISNHLANLPETVGIIRRHHFLSMRSYATFINTGRGPQLSETDLLDALVADPTRFALIDVMTDEAHSDGNPLNQLPNCKITPHIAGSSGREVCRMADYMLSALSAYVSAIPSPHEVTLPMLSTLA